MENHKVVNVLLVVLAIGSIGFFVFSNNKQAASQTQRTKIGENTVESATTEDANNNNEFSKRFISYSDENLQKASANGRAVVFFHASWCPLCNEAEADLKANWGNVPSDVTILKTDYDSSKALKGTYGVVSQDTWVQVDQKGSEITKWNSGGRGLSSLLANLK